MIAGQQARTLERIPQIVLRCAHLDETGARGNQPRVALERGVEVAFGIGDIAQSLIREAPIQPGRCRLLVGWRLGAGQHIGESPRVQIHSYRKIRAPRGRVIRRQTAQLALRARGVSRP